MKLFLTSRYGWILSTRHKNNKLKKKPKFYCIKMKNIYFSKYSITEEPKQMVTEGKYLPCT